jgi:ADP-ribose pyrophosphatase YjhB (NUDIX family)
VRPEEEKHCPLCAGALELEPVSGRSRLRCGACGFVLYRNPAAASLGVVLNERAEVLMVRRAIQPYRDHWALPAGYQEIDEEPAETVVREVREETGVEIEVCGLLDLLFVQDPRKPANVAVFLARPVGGTLAAGAEETHVDWFALDALPDPIGFDNYPRILKRLLGAGGYPDSPWNQVRSLFPGP